MNKSIYLTLGINTMKKLLLSTFFICIYCLNINAQCPPSNIIRLTSQQELNNFAANYPNCTVLDNLYIGTYGTPSDIDDLSPLSSLTIISNVLQFINNPLLTNLDGLDNLFIIGQDLRIEDNVNLLEIDALSSLLTLGLLDIKGNTQLSNLDGLENISGSVGRITIENNDALSNLNALQGLVQSNVIIIKSNAMLTDIFGLQNVNIQNQGLFIIEDNPILSLCSLPNVCIYLNSFNSLSISNNAMGCNSSGEVRSACLLLPVELINFTAETQRGSVRLTWQTASETNNQGFEIQRSKDGINWEKIGYQQGAGNSTSTQDYRHNDTQPLSGINYYRLKQMDVEGDFIYSDIVSVSYGNKGFAVFPVPAKDEITLQLESPQTAAKIRISNIIGEVIHTQDLQLSEGVNQVTFDISGYTNGIYFLTMNNGDKNGTQRFVKH